MTITVEEIRHKITSETGARTSTQLTAAGIAVGVQMRPGDPDYLWALIPIDDESRDALAHELVRNWRRENSVQVRKVDHLQNEDHLR